MTAFEAARELIHRSTQAFVRMHSRRPENHRCRCGSGLSRLVLIAGYMHDRLGVRATIMCRDCGSSHRLRGNGHYERYVFCVARDNVRPKVKRWVD